MDRACGWVELVGLTSRRRAAALRLERVRCLVADASGPGWTARLREADGRWHVWIEPADSGGSTAGMLPFFKAVGSVVPTSCGVLDLAGPRRWVMHAGTVDLVRSPDRASAA